MGEERFERSVAASNAYDPDLGRWLSRDPLKGAELTQGPNLYAYVQINPTNAFDREGTDTHLNDDDYLWGTGRSAADANKLIAAQNRLLDDWTKNYFDAFLGVANRSWRAAQEGKYLVDIV